MKIKEIKIKTGDAWDEIKSPYKGVVSFEEGECEHVLSFQAIAVIFATVRNDVQERAKAAEAVVTEGYFSLAGGEREEL